MSSVSNAWLFVPQMLGCLLDLIDSVIDCFLLRTRLFCLFAFLKSEKGLFNDKCNGALKYHKIGFRC